MKSTRCALFEGLSDGEISAVAEKIKFAYKTFSRGEEIFVYGSDDGKLCHLAEGVAETIRTDENGAVALQPVYEKAMRFNDGLAAVQKNGTWYLIDERGVDILSGENTQV